MKSKIIILTGSRAEYALLRPLISKLNKVKSFNIKLIISGTHLSDEFGHTEFEIIKDKFIIYKKIKMIMSHKEDFGMAKSVGFGMIKFAKCFAKVKPNLLICLGDRFEIFAGAYAAAMLNIPIAHIHGGELTYGAIDDKFRHAITKSATIHFASTNIYAKRIIQMGEYPNTVFNVGALGVERVLKVGRMSLKEIKNELKIDLKNHFFLLTIHPETVSSQSIKSFVNEIFEALDFFYEIPIIISYSNSDTGGILINKLLNQFCKKNPKKRVIKKTLGHKLYINCLRKATAVIGNSSSGVIEAPIVGVPSVNIGNRQQGRIMTKSTITSKSNKKDIIFSIKKAMNFSKEQNITHPFGDGKTSTQIVSLIKKHLNKKNNNIKKFYDLKF